MKLRMKIISISLVPALLIGILSLVFALTVTKDAMVDEVRLALKGTASATLAAYEQNSGEYTRTENGDIWKGGYNVSRSDILVDDIKAKSGMDVTFFYGDQRIMTSAKDADGNRILGSPAGDAIVAKVLKGGEEYFSSAVSLDGVLTYGYYIPVYQPSGQEPIGMVFVGANKAEKDAAIDRLVGAVSITVGAVMVLCVLVALQVSGTISKHLKTSIGVARTVATGQLEVDISQKLTKRKDEIGELSRAMLTLRDELKGAMTDISRNAEELAQAADVMGNASKDANASMQQVKSSTTMITESSEEQAENSRNTSYNMNIMGENITETSGAVEDLNENAAAMQQASTQAAQTVTELQSINARVTQSIMDVQEQTIRTNEAVKKISNASKAIASIAGETNLLSVNARIEAARAGVAGKGFAVVANQVRDLATQSDRSSKEIETITEVLMEESTKAVEIMNEMQGILQAQNRSMEDTKDVMSRVLGQIDGSMSSIQQIQASTRKLESSRNQVVAAVGELSSIAQDNAASTHETADATALVADTLEQVSDSAQHLQKIADELVQGIQYFKL